MQQGGGMRRRSLAMRRVSLQGASAVPEVAANAVGASWDAIHEADEAEPPAPPLEQGCGSAPVQQHAERAPWDDTTEGAEASPRRAGLHLRRGSSKYATLRTEELSGRDDSGREESLLVE